MSDPRDPTHDEWMAEIAKAKVTAEDLDAQTFWARLREFVNSAVPGISFMSINRIEATMILDLRDGISEGEAEVIGEEDDDGDERRSLPGELQA